MCLCPVRSSWIHPISQMGHVQVDSEMNVHCCHSCRLKSQVAEGAVCQVSHGIKFQGGEIHTFIDYNILVRLITGLEIEECTRFVFQEINNNLSVKSLRVRPNCWLLQDPLLTLQQTLLSPTHRVSPEIHLETILGPPIIKANWNIVTLSVHVAYQHKVRCIN